MSIATGKRVSAKEAAAIPDALANLDDIIDVSAFMLPAGIYFLYLGDSLQYIGQSIEPSARIVQHKKMGKTFDRVYFLPTPTENLLQVEGELIKKYRPPLNNLPDVARQSLKDPKLDQWFREMTERDLKPFRDRAKQEAADRRKQLEFKL